jgi:hypothetical protein
LLEENIRKVKLSTPDYRDMDPEEAVRDFHTRRENYMRVYEPVSERDGPHLKIINSKQFIVNNIRGYLPLKVSIGRKRSNTMPSNMYLSLSLTHTHYFSIASRSSSFLISTIRSFISS